MLIEKLDPTGKFDHYFNSIDYNTERQSTKAYHEVPISSIYEYRILVSANLILH